MFAVVRHEMPGRDDSFPGANAVLLYWFQKFIRERENECLQLAKVFFVGVLRLFSRNESLWKYL
jgi:hypothetical protein